MSLIVKLYPGRDNILKELSSIFDFDYEAIGYDFDGRGYKKNIYKIHGHIYAQKAHLNDFIVNGKNGKPYGRADVLYSLYACRHLTIGDIEYPTYDDFKNRNFQGATLDHIFPKKYFPEWTFDCENWQSLTWHENQAKGVEFLNEAISFHNDLESELQAKIDAIVNL